MDGKDAGEDHEPVISAPVISVSCPTTLSGAASAQRAELLAKRGLAVASEAVILDVDIQDHVVAYLYYCSAVKILYASLKGLCILFSVIWDVVSSWLLVKQRAVGLTKT